MRRFFLLVCYLIFFFSSRRRHTRFDCDWSSDVCSSDLSEQYRISSLATKDASISCVTASDEILYCSDLDRAIALFTRLGLRLDTIYPARSEERRVGKEGRSRWLPDHLKKKKE